MSATTGSSGSATGTSNNDDLGPEIIIASWVLTAAAALFLFTRVGAKLWTRRGLWKDDYVLLVSWLFVLVSAITSTLAVGLGLGRHIDTVPIQNSAPLSVLLNVTVTALIFAAALSKTSFALTVLRLVGGRMRVATWFILVTMNVLLLANVITLWVAFKPNPEKAAATTPSPAAVALQTGLTNYAIAATAYSAAMDFALVAMAWIVASRLCLRSRREKFGVAIAMSMGLIAGATSIVKAVTVPSLGSARDITFVAAPLHIWSIVEPSVTIIAASIPLLRILLVHLREISTRTGGTAGYAQSRSAQGTGAGTVRSSVHGGGAKRASYGPRLGGLRLADLSGEDIMLESVLESAEEIGREGASDGGRGSDAKRAEESWIDVRDESESPGSSRSDSASVGAYGKRLSTPNVWPGRAL